ncbi:Acyl-CoA dehydrogenase [Salinivirga cyanobacteriivorans]|uniref:Cyclohex-1-ene-1-carbonyl-CoA dehydrogenase n=1 Tax=Salinivirga cyanobacteriivorans TaxID=1307839 RepID=A0A0S2I2C6_9BACT|nr:acyl-CoA dehydrogenase family protein [Salinivirga cyanobacteriivorans]ALO16502.1 Acyl-CoA dehydrogenase [Salinivirga cyanobacteriivorans]
MHFEYTEEQLMAQQSARDLAQKEFIKDVIERDTNAIFPEKHVKKLAELGFMGMQVDPKYDGTGMDTVSYVLAIEEISKVDSSLGVIMSVNNSLVCFPIEKYGNEEQKEKYLKPLARGDKLGAFLLSEPEAGSDATRQRTIAEDKGDHYVINGTKNWITSGNSADTYVVIAHTHPEKGHKGINAFIVDRHSEGISPGQHEDKMGMRSSDTHSVMFSDVKVPKENRLSDDGMGFKIAMKTLEAGRLGIAAQALGLASGAYELSLKYAKERKAFGTEIINHQAIAFKLADMATDIEMMRLLAFKAAWLKDNGKPFGTASAMAKLACADKAMQITTEAVQIHGGYGYVKEYHVERLMRDAKLTQIYEGTSEIQKIVISRAITNA